MFDPGKQLLDVEHVSNWNFVMNIENYSRCLLTNQKREYTRNVYKSKQLLDEVEHDISRIIHTDAN